MLYKDISPITQIMTENMGKRSLTFDLIGHIKPMHDSRGGEIISRRSSSMKNDENRIRSSIERLGGQMLIKVVVIRGEMSKQRRIESGAVVNAYVIVVAHERYVVLDENRVSKHIVRRRRSCRVYLLLFLCPQDSTADSAEIRR